MQRIKTSIEKNGDSDIFDYNYSRTHIDTRPQFFLVFQSMNQIQLGKNTNNYNDNDVPYEIQHTFNEKKTKKGNSTFQAYSLII